MAIKVQEFKATGRRKESVARVCLANGVGKVSVNGREFGSYFPTEALREIVESPLKLTETLKQYDVIANVSGGGVVGQAGAVRQAISRALLLVNAELRPTLKTAGFLTRDPRMKERKKSGRPGARKRFQFSKR